MNHQTNINDIEHVINRNRLCLFYVKAPDCGVCNVMFSKVGTLTENYAQLVSFYTDITEEPLIASRFLVYSSPTVLLILDGKEVYRSSQFIDLKELERKIGQLIQFCDL